MPHNDKVIFIHIPKTAGTSVNNALKLDGMRSSTENPSPQHLIPSKVKKELGIDFWNRAFKFTIVRNPYTRMESEFLWRLIRGGLPPDIPVKFKWRNDEQSFHDFLLFVKGIKDYSTYTFDHFRSQADYVVGLDKIFHFEKLWELEEHFGIKLPKMNVRKLRPYELLSDRNKDLIKVIHKDDFNL